MRIFGLEVRRVEKPQSRFLGELVKVDLSPGDVCVLLTREKLAPDAAARASAAFIAAFGEDVTLLILDGGMKIGVLSPPQAAEVHERLADERAVEQALR